HPNNPLVICYPPSVVQECVDWCREREVHLISDEIYTGSVYRPLREGGSPTFVSAMALASNYDSEGASGRLGLGPFVHLVYALSTLQGLCLVGPPKGGSINRERRDTHAAAKAQRPVPNCSWSGWSWPTPSWKTGTRAASRKKSRRRMEAVASNLRARCDESHATLDDLNVPHLRADLGLFAWLDLRRYLSPLPPGVTEATESAESRERRERELYLKLTNDYGLLFIHAFKSGLGRLREFVRW
ncbi:hypothetical protein ACHAWF_000379, partial [Thalassiosira exigua]